MTILRPILTTVLLLTASNVFMTIAWCGHLKHLNTAPWWIAALIALGAAIALFRFKQNVIHVIAACAVLGLAIKAIL